MGNKKGQVIMASGFSPIAVDHADCPRNMGRLRYYNGHAQVTGECGDTMWMWLFIENEEIQYIAFETDGCGSSRACGSMTTSLVKSKTVEMAMLLNSDVILGELGEFPEDHFHCADLAAATLHQACELYTEARLQGKIKIEKLKV